MATGDLLARRAILSRAVVVHLTNLAERGGSLGGRDVAALYAIAALGPAPVPAASLAPAIGVGARYVPRLLAALEGGGWVERCQESPPGWQLGPNLLATAHRLGATADVHDGTPGRTTP